MTDEHKGGHCVEETLKFINDIIKTKQELFSNKMNDCNDLLKRFGYRDKTQINDDSGFESEPCTEVLEKCLIPSTVLLEVFDKNIVDSLFELCLKDVCDYLQKVQYHTDLAVRIETILETIVKCVEVLEETNSNIPIRDIIQVFLDVMLENAIRKNDNDLQFEFVLQLIRRFERLGEYATDILIKHLNIFAENLRNQPIDASFSFCFESDFTRLNSMLLTLLTMMKGNKRPSTYESTELCSITESFVNHDDFFNLGYLSYKCLLTE